MSYIDLKAALSEWPYEPEKISVRKILGADGSVRIQMRVEMGIVQMEGEGRPDGTRPFGCVSLLAYHQKRLTKHDERNGTTLGYGLSPLECQALRAEASLYYRRYIALFVLEEYADVARDTSHSLAIFDLAREHALEPNDRVALDEFRPYVLMMDARGRAYQAMEESEPASAIAHINRGIMNVKGYFERVGHPELVGSSEELKILRTLGMKVGDQIPKSSRVVTRRALRDAIEQERFEDAAKLRDQLKNRQQTKKLE